jgi:DNA polymerase-3 subunit alpha
VCSSDLLIAELEDGRSATILLGRDFALDGELAERIGEVPGVSGVEVSPLDPPRLALVS